MANLSNSSKIIAEIDKKANRTELHTYTPGTGININNNDEVSINLQPGIGIAINGNEISASGMVILKYGTSTWADFIDAYNKHMIVYCRASSGGSPETGAQTRLAFMAYVTNELNPTEVEFQYYRTVKTKNITNQGDEVYVYKLNSSTGWSYEKRNTFTRITVGAGLKSSYSGGVLTISLDTGE